MRYARSEDVTEVTAQNKIIKIEPSTFVNYLGSANFDCDVDYTACSPG